MGPARPDSGRGSRSQFTATTAENIGFNLNSVLQQAIAGHLSEGAVSMNAYATRLLLVPITGLLQPIQQRLLIRFSTDSAERTQRTIALSVAGGLSMGAAAGAGLAAFLAFSEPWWPSGWQRSFAEYHLASVLLAYGLYAGVVFSNQSLARFLFAQGRGWTYAVGMLAAYTVGTAGKLFLAPRWGIVALPLSALGTETACLLWLLRAAKLHGSSATTAAGDA